MTWLARAFIASGLLLLVACGQAPQPYDVAINNGRLIDPESRLDAVRSVGIRAGKIAAISKTPLKAENVGMRADWESAPASLICIPIAWQRPDISLNYWMV